MQFQRYLLLPFVHPYSKCYHAYVPILLIMKISEKWYHIGTILLHKTGLTTKCEFDEKKIYKLHIEQSYKYNTCGLYQNDSFTFFIYVGQWIWNSKMKRVLCNSL